MKQVLVVVSRNSTNGNIIKRHRHGVRSLLTSSLQAYQRQHHRLQGSFLPPVRLSSSTSKGPSSSPHRAVTLTLYRQLLRWCKSTGDSVPFDPIPPLHLVPPNVDASSLASLASFVSLRNAAASDNGNGNVNSNGYDSRFDWMCELVPRGAVVEASRLTMSLDNAREVRDVTRLVYRLNQQTTAADKGDGGEYLAAVSKARITVAFETLRSLNQLTDLLDRRKDARDANTDRTGVHYNVGQVVQHKTDRWRAVIAGWRRIQIDTPPTYDKTSLTQKNYVEPTIDTSADTQDNDPSESTQIEYILHLDEGDAALSRINASASSQTALQHELSPVHDPQLLHLRNPFLPHAFQRLSQSTGRYIPSTVLHFEYPSDSPPPQELTELGEEDARRTVDGHMAAREIVAGVVNIADGWRAIVRDGLQQSDDADNSGAGRRPPILAQLDERLTAVVDGRVTNAADRLEPPSAPGGAAESSQKLAVRYLAALVNVGFEIVEVMGQRRAASRRRADGSGVKFPLGSLVRHRRYGFRGIVSAWDPYPKTDVSRWDGLKDLEGDPNAMPFYHVVADKGDTARAFGQERPWRYVCEENLEVCSGEDGVGMDIGTDEMDGWVVERGGDGTTCTPPDEVKFRHAESLGDDEELMNTCMQEITNQLTTDLNLIKQRSTTTTPSSQPQPKLSLDALFHLLRSVDNADDAYVVQETIKEIWKTQTDPETRFRLDDAGSALLRGDKSGSLQAYDEVLATEDGKDCVEAWNRKATCHYLLGETELSMEAAEQALRCEPRHFQAWSGLGLLYHDIGKHRKAAESFRRSLELDPWGRVGSRLCVCLDTLKRLEGGDDDGVEGTEIGVVAEDDDPTRVG